MARRLAVRTPTRPAVLTGFSYALVLAGTWFPVTKRCVYCLPPVRRAAWCSMKSGAHFSPRFVFPPRAARRSGRI